MRGKFALFLCSLAIALGTGGAAPKAADDENDCTGTPLEAVVTLPAPLRKWGQIECTPYGHILVGRDGWVWARLDGGSQAFVPSQMVERDPAPLGNTSYFTALDVAPLNDDATEGALRLFEAGLDMSEKASGYRLDATSVSGQRVTLYFFDFGSFAGGMWCPDGECFADTRFMIMAKEHKPQDGSV